MNRSIVFVFAGLTIALLLSIAFFGHHKSVPTEQLRLRCQAKDTPSSHIARARACKALYMRENPKKRPAQK